MFVKAGCVSIAPPTANKKSSVGAPMENAWYESGEGSGFESASPVSSYHCRLSKLPTCFSPVLRSRHTSVLNNRKFLQCAEMASFLALLFYVPHTDNWQHCFGHLLWYFAWFCS